MKVKVKLIRIVFGLFKFMSNLKDDFKYNFKVYVNHINPDYESEDIMLSRIKTKAHILDKGLNMTPFQAGRSKSAYKIIKNLINDFDKKFSNFKKDPSYNWARNIVKTYEKKQLNPSISVNSQNKILKSNSLEKLIKERVSVRNFKHKIIDKNTWIKIVECAMSAPSSCHRQPANYYIVSKKEIKDILLSCIAGSTGFANGIPYLVIVSSDIRAYNINDRYTYLVDTSLSVNSFILGCKAYGVGSTIMNWSHATNRQNKTVKKVLGITNDEKIVTTIACGFPNVLPHKPKSMNPSRKAKFYVD